MTIAEAKQVYETLRNVESFLEGIQEFSNGDDEFDDLFIMLDESKMHVEEEIIWGRVQELENTLTSAEFSADPSSLYDAAEKEFMEEFPH